MQHFRLGSFQIKQLMSSCIQQKLLLNLLLTEAKTKTLAQKLKTQQNLHSFVRCKLRNLSRRRFNLIFKKTRTQGYENCIMTVRMWMRMPDPQ